ncbi:hypothetical protein Baya_15206 [Bagarius yarrelli]|uniref:Uncharacterized protein n=1 Tax=Bagarius yarrelli TaxID=175774 RepID=A0A556VB41_BAGYA|nr:hypothetical protein Baya_15206 [Bagarius yarrelli]
MKDEKQMDEVLHPVPLSCFLPARCSVLRAKLVLITLRERKVSCFGSVDREASGRHDDAEAPAESVCYRPRGRSPGELEHYSNRRFGTLSPKELEPQPPSNPSYAQSPATLQPQTPSNPSRARTPAAKALPGA